MKFFRIPLTLISEYRFYSFKFTFNQLVCILHPTPFTHSTPPAYIFMGNCIYYVFECGKLYVWSTRFMSRVSQGVLKSTKKYLKNYKKILDIIFFSTLKIYLKNIKNTHIIQYTWINCIIRCQFRFIESCMRKFVNKRRFLEKKVNEILNFNFP